MQRLLRKVRTRRRLIISCILEPCDHSERERESPPRYNSPSLELDMDAPRLLVTRLTVVYSIAAALSPASFFPLLPSFCVEIRLDLTGSNPPPTPTLRTLHQCFLPRLGCLPTFTPIRAMLQTKQPPTRFMTPLPTTCAALLSELVYSSTAMGPNIYHLPPLRVCIFVQVAKIPIQI